MSVPAFHFPASEAGRLLHVSQMLSRVPGLSGETKQIYRVWILGYLRYLERSDLGDPEPEHVRAFMRRLSETGRVSEERRQQATEALIFFHEIILEQEVSDVDSRLDMLTESERAHVLGGLSGSERMLAQIIFSTDLGIAEALRLRVGDVDVKQQQLTVTNERGCTMGFADISADLARDLKIHLHELREQHDRDRAEGHGAVDLPGGVHEQFPNAHVAWVWQYVFPSTERSFDPTYGCECRYPMQPERLMDALELRTASTQRFGEMLSSEQASGGKTTGNETGSNETGNNETAVQTSGAAGGASETDDSEAAEERAAPAKARAARTPATDWTSIYS